MWISGVVGNTCEAVGRIACTVSFSSKGDGGVRRHEPDIRGSESDILARITSIDTHI